MRVIVTRPAAQAADWVERLVRSGVEAVALPLIGVEPLDDPAPLVAAWHGLAGRRLVVFVSPNAVLRFFAARPAGLDWPATAFAGSPGPGTSRTLRQIGVPAERIVEPAADAVAFDAAALWQVLQPMDWRAAEVLIVRGTSGRDALPTLLGAAGARVAILAAYRRGVVEPDAAARALLQLALARPEAHLWFFSSSAAIDRLAELIPPDQAPASLLAASAIATHPQIAATARARGIGRVIEVRPSPEAVIACLQSRRL